MVDLEMQTIRNIIGAINEHQRFLVATHIRPDGDAIGSLLAAICILRKLGKQADPFCQDAVPCGQEFLPGAGEIRHSDPEVSAYDAALLVDCGELHRVGPTLAESIARIPFLINIDHHVNDAPYGHAHWVKTAASSTCEMLYDLNSHLGLELDPDLATQLYTGLMTDTGSFRFSNTNQRVLETATKLVACGADPAYIAQQVYDSATPQGIRLLARVLSTVAFAADNRLATAHLAQEMLAETGTTPMDSEGFINHLRSVKSVEMAMLFREENNGTVHVSVRSKGSVDVAGFARKYKGGGHRHAAAFRTSGTLDRIREQFTREALSYLK